MCVCGCRVMYKHGHTYFMLFTHNSGKAIHGDTSDGRGVGVAATVRSPAGGNANASDLFSSYGSAFFFFLNVVNLSHISSVNLSARVLGGAATGAHCRLC